MLELTTYTGIGSFDKTADQILSKSSVILTDSKSVYDTHILLLSRACGDNRAVFLQRQAHNSLL